MKIGFERLRNILGRHLGMSKGERSLLWSHLTVGFFGLGFGLIILLRINPDAIFSVGPSLYEYWLLASGVLGANLALRLAQHRLGRPGFLDAVKGIALVTFVAPILAGTLALPGYGTMFGPFTLGLIFWAAPITAALWFTSLTGVHLMMRQWHSERDSIFGQESEAHGLGLLRLLKQLQLR